MFDGSLRAYLKDKMYKCTFVDYKSDLRLSLAFIFGLPHSVYGAQHSPVSAKFWKMIQKNI